MTTFDDKFFSRPTAAPPTPPSYFDRVDFSCFDLCRERNCSKRARFDSNKLSDEELVETLVMLSSSGGHPMPYAVVSSCPGNIAAITGASPATGPSTDNENKLMVTTTTPVTVTAAAAEVRKAIEISFPQPSKNGRTFKCNICGKFFSSHQALGGHKTSHRVKLPPKVTATENNTSAAVAAVSEESAPNPAGRKLHKCSICHRTFTSGQALGGHKRLHYMVTSVKSVVTSSNNGSSTATTNSYFDGDGDSQTTPFLTVFDLNECKPPSYQELDLTLKLD